MNSIELIKQAIELRSKAWRHHGAALAMQDVAADHSGYRRLEFTARSSSLRRKVTLQVYFWEDRWIWMDAREGTKMGWNWEWTTEGRVDPDLWGKALTKKVEDTFLMLYGPADQIPLHLGQKWATTLATGPRLVI